MAWIGFTRASRAMALAATAAVALGMSAAPAHVEPSKFPGGGPSSVADLAAGLLDAVVNISTSQTVKGDESPEGVPIPKLPEGSPFEDYFNDFFNNHGDESDDSPRKVQSLGSGFIIDAAKGLVVTNNHVITDADDIEVNFSDGAKLKATLVGTDTKTDIALLKVDPSKHKLKAV
ncbi:MAG: trypsin-like peptidase domain-containing protein, partial [Rhizobiaceae bacterium]